MLGNDFYYYFDKITGYTKYKYSNMCTNYSLKQYYNIDCFLNLQNVFLLFQWFTCLNRWFEQNNIELMFYKIRSYAQEDEYLIVALVILFLIN